MTESLIKHNHPGIRCCGCVISPDNNRTVYKKYHDSSKSITSIPARYARFMRLKLGDAAGARTTLESALAEDDRNPNLFLQLLDIALHEHPLKADAVVALLDNAMEKVGEIKMLGLG